MTQPRTQHSVYVSRWEKGETDAWALYASTYKTRREALDAVKRALAEGYVRAEYRTRQTHTA